MRPTSPRPVRYQTTSSALPAEVAPQGGRSDDHGTRDTFQPATDVSRSPLTQTQATHTATPAPAQLNKPHRGVSLRAPARNRLPALPPAASWSELTARFITRNQRTLSGDLTSQSRQQLAVEMCNDPSFTRFKDAMAVEMTKPDNKRAVDLSVDHTIGTERERAQINRNFYSVMMAADLYLRNNSRCD